MRFFELENRAFVMPFRIHLASLVLSLALGLAACGGGGGASSDSDASATDSSAEASAKSMVDQLEGLWETCFVAGGVPVTSFREIMRITRLSQTQFLALSSMSVTNSGDCSGEPHRRYEVRNTLTLTRPAAALDKSARRQVPVQGLEAVHEDASVFFNVFHIGADDQLWLGDRDDLASDGYPRSLDLHYRRM